MLAGTARGQDATWLLNPVSGDFNTAANWTPATVPTGTAFFDLSNTTNLSFSADTAIGGWTFNAGASNYTFTNAQVLTFNGAGVVINGGGATITNVAFLGYAQFANTSTAGNATIINNNVVEFFDTSTAGSATITNNLTLQFSNASTAGSATITNTGTVDFFNASTAGSATIANQVI